MLKPENNENHMANKKKPRVKKSGITVRDLSPRKDYRGGTGGPVKSSPVPLPIPPDGFIVSSGDSDSQ